MRFGVFKTLGLICRKDKLTAAIRRIILPPQIPLDFKVCRLFCNSTLIRTEDLANFGLGDARVFPNYMDQIKLRCTDSGRFHSTGGKFPNLPRNFSNLAF